VGELVRFFIRRKEHLLVTHHHLQFARGGAELIDFLNRRAQRFFHPDMLSRAQTVHRHRAVARTPVLVVVGDDEDGV